MSKELFRDASKCKNKKQEVRRKNKSEQKKLEGKSLDIRDGGLDIHPPLYVLLEIKKLENVQNAPLTPLPLQKITKNAGAD